MSELSKKEKDIITRIDKYLYENKITNDCLVQLIELCGGYLNLKTIPNYAKDNNLSYNGVKKTRNIINLFNIKFVIDNH